MARVLTFIVCLCVLCAGVESNQGNTGQWQVTCDSPEVTAKVGETVILPCSLKTQYVTNFTVEWVVNGHTDVHMYRHQRNELHNQGPDYKDRTSLSLEECNYLNISLKLNVTNSHSGSYQCTVKYGDALKSSCCLNLTVVDKDSHQTTDQQQDTQNKGMDNTSGKGTTAAPKEGKEDDGLLSCNCWCHGLIGFFCGLVIAAVAVRIWKKKACCGAGQNQQGPDRPGDNAEVMPLNTQPGRDAPQDQREADRPENNDEGSETAAQQPDNCSEDE